MSAEIDQIPCNVNEKTIHLALLGLALIGLIAGLALPRLHLQVEAGLIWSAATIPVIIALTISIIRDFWIGRVGVDAIALVAMSAEIAMTQPVAGVVVTIMYTGGNVLEDYARGRPSETLENFLHLGIDLAPEGGLGLKE